MKNFPELIKYNTWFCFLDLVFNKNEKNNMVMPKFGEVAYFLIIFSNLYYLFIITISSGKNYYNYL